LSAVRRFTSGTFAALAVRNYRLFFLGQVVSVSGTWMQMIAQDWLVLNLTDSGFALGFVTALQFLPMLVVGPWAGVLADRVDKRRLLIAMNVTAGLLGLTLGILTATGSIQLWMVYVLALGLGLANAFEMPARQAFSLEMVGPEKLTNAVGLNSIIMNAGRLVGPALGGVLIATLGLAVCFLLNAASYIIVVVALVAMRPQELIRTAPVARAKGQLREGFRYVWSTPGLRTPLVVIAVVGTFAYEFQVSLPLLARFTFGTGADGYGILQSAMGVGAIVGGLALATRIRPSHRGIGWACLAFGSAILLVAAMPSMVGAVLALPLVGATSILVVTQSNSILQLTAPPEMRARVIALYGVAFVGSTPVGGPIVGWVGEQMGGRAALAIGGIAAIATALVAWRSLGRASDQPPTVRPEPAPRPARQEPRVEAATPAPASLAVEAA
jgi:MFS family permease